MDSRSAIEVRKNFASKFFCFFSGFTKGMVEVKEIKKDDDLKIFHIVLSIPENLNKKHSRYIQLDGVLCEILYQEKNIMIVSTTFELVENTSLKNIKIRNSVSLGVLAESEPIENQGYLLHPSAGSFAKLTNISLLAGHKHTLKLDFEYFGNPEDLQENKHIGMAGSSLTVQNVSHGNGLSRFSIYAGKQTQENTCFNRGMPVDQIVNVTLAKLDI